MLEAFGRCGLRPSAIEQEHLISARRCVNLMLVDWANMGTPNLWAVDLQTQLLAEDDGVYDLSPTTILILDAYISTTDDDGNVTDRIIYPISRSDYAAFPNKLTSGPPNVFWFDRLITPTINLWPVPDDGGPYTLKYYRMRQLQDAAPTQGQTPDMPYRFLSALCSGWAAKLALTWAPDRAKDLAAQAMADWSLVTTADREQVAIYIRPDLSGYWN